MEEKNKTECSFRNSSFKKCTKKAIYGCEKFCSWNGEPIKLFGVSDRENSNYDFMLACEKHSKAYKDFSAPIFLVKKRTKIRKDD